MTYRLLKDAGLDAVITEGNAGGGLQAWTLVKIENQWYQLDTTWDDPVPDLVGRTVYNYYLLTDSQINSDHKWTNTYPKATQDYGDVLMAKMQEDPTNKFFQDMLALLGYDYVKSENTATDVSSLHDRFATAINAGKTTFKIRYMNATTVRNDVATALQGINGVTKSSYSDSPFVRTPENDVIVEVRINADDSSQPAVQKKLVSIKASDTKIGLKLGNQKQVMVTATYSDQSTEDITNQVTWSSTKPAVADVTNGMVLAKDYGTASIKGTYEGKSISVSVDASLKKLVIDKKKLAMKVGSEEKVILTATYADASKEDVTSRATWTSSSKKGEISVTNGTIKVNNFGSATVKAVFGGKNASITVDVTIKKLVVDQTKLALKPGNEGKLQLTATFADTTTEDVTSQAVWTSSNKDILVDKGIVNSAKYTKGNITAEFGGKRVTIAVDFSIMSIKIDNTKLALKPGDQVTLQVTAIYADGTTENIASKMVWSVTGDKDKVTVDAGKITVVAFGKAAIKGGYEGKTITVSLDASIKNLEVDKKQLALSKGNQDTVVVTATCADGTKKDVTDLVTWQSTKATIASVDKGAIQALLVGNTTIKGQLSGKAIMIPVVVQ